MSYEAAEARERAVDRIEELLEENAKLKKRVLVLEARETELQENGSKHITDARSWKARAEGLRKVLTALVIELPLVSSTKDERELLHRLAGVAFRNEELERDAWTRTTQAARAFVKEAHEPMGDYAPSVVRPVDGDGPVSAFVRKHALAIKTILDEAG